MSFQEKLQRLRKEKNMSQEELADLLNVTRQSVSKWESGLTLPEIDKMLAISKLFACSVDALIDDKKELSVISHKKKIFDSIKKILIIILKVFLFLVACGTYLSMLLIYLFLTISIYLIINRVYYFGPFIILIFSAILCFAIIYTIFSYLFNKKLDKFKPVMLCMISFVGIGIGMGVFGVEIFNTNYIDLRPKNRSVYDYPEYYVWLNATEVKKYKMNDNLKITNRRDNEIRYSEINGEIYGETPETVYESAINRYKFVNDENLTDTVKIEVKYNNKMYDGVKLRNEDNIISWNWYAASTLNFLNGGLKMIIEDLQNKRIINWFNENGLSFAIPVVTVYTSSENIEILKNNLKEFYGVKETN